MENNAAVVDEENVTSTLDLQLSFMRFYAEASDDAIDDIAPNLLKSATSEIARGVAANHDKIRAIFKATVKAMNRTKILMDTSSREEYLTLTSTTLEELRLSFEFTAAELSEMHRSMIKTIEERWPECH